MSQKHTHHSPNTSDGPAKEEDRQTVEQLSQLELELHQAREREKRALADYQNLIRRNQVERARLIKMANLDLIMLILPSLGNLRRAASQVEDQGLSMVIDQLFNKLKEFGLEKIEVVGQEFDLETMEVVEKKAEGDQVIEEVSPGYTLHGEVIQHAKVVVG